MDDYKGIMTQRTKSITLILLVGALTSFVLLSASLSNLELHAGTPFPERIQSVNNIPFPVNLTTSGTYSFTLLKGVFSLIFLLLIVYASVRHPVFLNIKRIFQLSLFMIPLLLLIIMISRIKPGQPARYANETIGISTPPSFDLPVSPIGQPPQGLIQLVIIAFVCMVGLLSYKILRIRLHPANIKDRLLKEAETALDAITMGENPRNVVIRCYFQMIRTLEEERGIERSYSMTTREFEDWLESNGFPIAPVHQLTRLFEKVRYGAQLTVKDGEETAVESLKEIIQFCNSEGNDSNG